MREHDVVYRWTIPFVAVHVACLGAVWTGVSAWSLVLCAVLYLVRSLAVTAGYHRYFSHRSYRTSRAFQVLLAFLCETTAQEGVLWWAAKHREHHRSADTDADPHSPVQRGFWFAHVGWIFSRSKWRADYTLVRDLSRHPELVWLDRHYWVPPATLGTAVWALFGWEGLVVGFLWSTVLVYHGTFAINSLGHTVGRQRFATGDASRNCWWLAVAFMGEGWHNNHHRYPSVCRQGLRWWEIDVTYLALRALARLGVVRELTEPPTTALEANGQRQVTVLSRLPKKQSPGANAVRPHSPAAPSPSTTVA